MKKLNKVLLTLCVLTSVLFVSNQVLAVNVEKQLLTDYGTQGGNNYPQVVVSHESGNANNTGTNSLENEISYMTRTWNNSWGNSESAHYWVGGGGRVVQLVPERRAAFHAGTWANYNGIGVELARTSNKATFNKDYKAYVDLQREIAQRYNIPLTLDDGAYKGIKSHLWISNNIWGDHADPYAYLSSWGISKAQYANDLKYGFKPSDVKPTEPTKPTPKPTEYTGGIKVGDKVKVKNAVQYDNGQGFYANGIYDVIEVVGKRAVIGKGNVVTAAISTDNLTKDLNVKEQEKPSKVEDTGWIEEDGTFQLHYSVNLRTGASTNHSLVATLFAGDVVYYDAFKNDSNGYQWLRQRRADGSTAYIASGTTSQGRKVSLYGDCY